MLCHHCLSWAMSQPTMVLSGLFVFGFFSSNGDSSREKIKQETNEEKVFNSLFLYESSEEWGIHWRHTSASVVGDASGWSNEGGEVALFWGVAWVDTVEGVWSAFGWHTGGDEGDCFVGIGFGWHWWGGEVALFWGVPLVVTMQKTRCHTLKGRGLACALVRTRWHCYWECLYVSLH